MNAERGAAILAVVLVFITAALLLAVAVGMIALAQVRLTETAVRGEENLARAQSGVEYGVARLAVDPAWRPDGPVTVAWKGDAATLVSATLDVAAETPPARLILTGRAGDVDVEARVLVDAPCLLAVQAETEVRIETGVEVAGPVAGDPVWVAQAGEPLPQVDLVVAPADAPVLRPPPVSEMAAAATRPLSDALYDSVTWKDEIVVLLHSDADDTTPFVLEDAVLDGASILVQGDLVIQGGFEGKPKPGYPLIVATGRITAAPSAVDRKAEGVIAAAGDVEIQGRFDHEGYIQGATVAAAGGEEAPVEVVADPGAEALGFEARVLRVGWRRE